MLRQIKFFGLGSFLYMYQPIIQSCFSKKGSGWVSIDISANQLKQIDDGWHSTKMYLVIPVNNTNYY